ncbi:MAG: hypothetical protein JW934_07935 [Anaerolineae bacterium]|nr:hypothetical protein [Anaerolineae bacterium]
MAQPALFDRSNRSGAVDRAGADGGRLRAAAQVVALSVAFLWIASAMGYGPF